MCNLIEFCHLEDYKGIFTKHLDIKMVAMVIAVKFELYLSLVIALLYISVTDDGI